MADKTLEEQEAIFQRARPIMEKILPELRDDELADQFTALTLALAQVTVRMGKTPEEALELVENNLPVMVTMWVNAFLEAAQSTKPPGVC
jgi:hypothetical protein